MLKNNDTPNDVFWMYIVKRKDTDEAVEIHHALSSEEEVEHYITQFHTWLTREGNAPYETEDIIVKYKIGAIVQ